MVIAGAHEVTAETKTKSAAEFSIEKEMGISETPMRNPLEHLRSIFDRNYTNIHGVAVARAVVKLRGDVLHRRFHDAGGVIFEQPAFVTRAIHNLRIHSHLMVEDVRLERARFVGGLAALHAFVGVAETDRRQAGAHGEFHRGANDGVGGHDLKLGRELDDFFDDRITDASVEFGKVKECGNRHGVEKG